MVGLFVGLKKWTRVGTILVLTLSFAFSYVQTRRVSDWKARSQEYSAKIAEYERAVLLTDQLYKNNAILRKERDDLLKELRNAEGYDTPLPPDIQRTLDRLR